MCGIVGFIGDNTEKTVLINLKKLEYRGYDSAGIALKCGNDIRLFKAKGEIKNLEKVIVSDRTAIMGIGHTRWATHGKPNEINAHPHVSANGEWYVVHNGIIENYIALKDKLTKKGFSFVSETDTESVAHLLEFYGEDGGLSALQKTCAVLKGSYALCVLNKSENRLFFAKNKSPLYVAESGGKIMVASDVFCFNGFADDYYPLEDGYFGYTDGNTIKFFDGLGEVKINKVKLDKLQTDDKNVYKHFMIKEIYETKSAIKNVIEHYSVNENRNKISDIKIKNLRKIILVGCGTAYHASLIGAKFIEEYSNVDCYACVASEFRYSKPKIGSDTLVVLISQSGETADTLAALELAKEKGAPTLAIVNVEYSTLAKKADVYMPIKAGVEIAVASTKAYSAQLVVLYILAQMIKEKTGVGSFDLSVVESLYENFNYGDVNGYKLLADVFGYNDRLFMIGRGVDYYTAIEAGLKIKETSYINSDTYYAGELKHGFLALVDDNTYVIVFATDKKIFEKTVANAEEARARGAKIILFTNKDLTATESENFYYVIKVKDINNPLQCVMNIVPWQTIAYYTSVSKGINPDKPRNLAKSVTVE